MTDKINVEGFSVSTTNVCTAEGGFVGDVTGNITGQTFGNVTTYTDTGSITLTDKLAKVDASTNVCAMSLADGTVGQIIRVKAIDVTNLCTLTPTNFLDGTTITFTPALEYTELTFDGTDWNVTGGNAAVT